jgi:uncharacterized protein
MSRKLFVNLPVAEIDKSIAFFTELGFAFDPRFTDAAAASMIVSGEAFVMLLTEDRFRDFATGGLCAHSGTEAILAVTAETRDEVDDLTDRALINGGQPASDPIVDDSMYGRSFRDLDGHHWEVVYIDPAAVEG